jgi:adenylate cyclase
VYPSGVAATLRELALLRPEDPTDGERRPDTMSRVVGVTREQVAERAGVDPSRVDRLVELGILRPSAPGRFSPADHRKIRWIESLERAGVTLDGIAAAVRDGRFSLEFLETSAFDRFPGVSDVTFRELSERTSIPMDILSLVRESIGLAEPRPDDHVRVDERSVIDAIELLLSEGFRADAIKRWLRVCGDSQRRIVETETDWYATDVMQRLLDEGMTETEMLDAQAELGSRISPRLEAANLAIYHGQQEQAWSKAFVEYAEGALERAGLYSRLRRPPAVSFLDITGYTRLTEERGDEAAADMAAKLGTLVRRDSREHGGEPIKWLGDGVMSYFEDPGGAVSAALDMVDDVARQELPPARVGIHAGPVLFQEGDYYGRTVNIAARIADYARPGEVLVSQDVVDAVQRSDVRFTDVGAVELKGVAEVLHLRSARR